MDYSHYPFVKYLSLIILFLPLILGYAEIHYRLPFLPSLLFRKEPEIIFDLPIRAQAGKPVPMFLIIKDAHLFPIRLQSLNISIGDIHPERENVIEIDLNTEISESFYSKTFRIDPKNFGEPGDYQIYARLSYRDSRKRNRQLVQDNYPGIPHPPFEIRISKTDLPKQEGWFWGDLHFHSIYTSDQVEFGAPLSLSVEAARTIGLDFLAVTDHSYDLDDDPENYRKNDPELKKWTYLQEEVKEINRKYQDFCLIPGEEVSVGNSQGKNVHCLILDDAAFLPGNGDSAENLLRNRPTLVLPKLFEKKLDNALVIAAHPVEKPPLSQRVILRRGIWNDSDFNSEKINTLQIMNNGSFKSLENGTRLWRSLLLTGKKVGIAAGNDAHGNFNSFRQVKIPLLKMDYRKEHLFGQVRTAVNASGLSKRELLEGIRNHRAIISTGPFINLEMDNTGKVAGIGETVKEIEKPIIQISGISTPEYGTWKSVQIVQGIFRQNRELKIDLNIKPNVHQLNEKLTLTEQADYIRLEGFTESGDRSYFCLTNPIWFEES
jgi:hypothetical protein